MLEPGTLLEKRYRVLRLVGEGGMGAVYEGENVKISRRVAIKVLHSNVAQNPEVVKRFEREAQAAGRIENDHITEVLDLGELEGGDRFIVMEFLQGESLAERLQRNGRLTPDALYPLVRQILVGLGAAHDAGIIHRDLKPDNVFILAEKAGRQDFVKLLDFGVSKFRTISSEGLNFTRTGALVGTPYYLSPEQARGSSDVTVRSDLYAVGVILYQGLTGRVPFRSSQFNDLLFKIALSDFTPPHEAVPELEVAFSSIVCKAMARDPKQRFAAASEFIAALDHWRERGEGVVVAKPSAIDRDGNVLPERSVPEPPESGTAALGNAQTLRSHPPTEPAEDPDNDRAVSASTLPSYPSIEAGREPVSGTARDDDGTLTANDDAASRFSNTTTSGMSANSQRRARVTRPDRRPIYVAAGLGLAAIAGATALTFGDGADQGTTARGNAPTGSRPPQRDVGPSLGEGEKLRPPSSPGASAAPELQATLRTIAAPAATDAGAQAAASSTRSSARRARRQPTPPRVQPEAPPRWFGSTRSNPAAR